MRSIWRFVLPAAGLMACLVPPPSWASGCVHEIVVPIRFQQGAACWRHVGIGTTFSGQFAAHQHVTASAIGKAYKSDGKRTWITAGPWQLSISGPGGFFADADANGQLDAVLPAAGQYSFVIGPCAVWGNDGTIEICTD